MKAAPRYNYSLRLLPPVLRVLLGIHSTLSEDAELLLPGAYPPPRVLTPENIPTDTPFILTMNHYDRPGLGAWWAASLIARTIAQRRTCEPRELHFAMAREWWYPRGFDRYFTQPLTHWFFGQIGKTYGAILLPPCLDNGQFRGEGTIAIRGACAMTRGEHPQLIAISPEGQTGANFGLRRPPPGAGVFLLLMAHDKIPILPAGIFEDEGNLVVKFGAPVLLKVPGTPPRDERDTRAAVQVMTAIGRQLPERMWGVYREQIAAAPLPSV